MNRKLMFGIAVFFAVVGLALTGSEKQVQAGWGSHGIHSCGGLFSRLHARRASCCGEVEPVCCAPAPAPTCGGGCGGHTCHGGLFARWHARRAARRCCGEVAVSCCGEAPVCAPACDTCGSACGGDCGGTVVVEEPAAEVPAAPAPEGA